MYTRLSYYVRAIVLVMVAVVMVMVALVAVVLYYSVRRNCGSVSLIYCYCVFFSFLLLFYVL